MNGAMQWGLIAAVLVAVLVVPRVIRRPPRPCMLCGAAGRHRVPRGLKPGLKRQPALCCTHADACSALRRQREATSTSPHRVRLWHLSQRRTA